jgi:hypothetical protein
LEFYDVPRCIATRYKGKLILLQSAFDEQFDDYAASYSVCLLPESVESSLATSSWKFLESTQLTLIGRIQVDSVRFDPTKRAELDPVCLDGLLKSSE